MDTKRNTQPGELTDEQTKMVSGGAVDRNIHENGNVSSSSKRSLFEANNVNTLIHDNK
jgi:hypothetical protein